MLALPMSCPKDALRDVPMTTKIDSQAAIRLMPLHCFLNLLAILISAILRISASVIPRPSGLCAMSNAYSPNSELRNGRVSSVCNTGINAHRDRYGVFTYAHSDRMLETEVIEDMVVLK